MKRTSLCILILSLLSLTSKVAAIEGVYEVIIRKQEQKKASRWTLADWLLTKQKMALMDQWLALNSSTSWFEFLLEGNGNKLTADNTPEARLPYESQAYRYQGALYIKAFGLQGGKDKVSGFQDSSFFQANLILLGSSAQSTHIQLHYGLRNLNLNEGEISPNYWGASTTLYLLPFLGALYDYRKYTKDSAGALSLSEGSRQEVGGFVDIWFLRLKATYFKERLKLNSVTNGAYDQQISGWWGGAQLFF
jgi:hypothetical protein